MTVAVVVPVPTKDVAAVAGTLEVGFPLCFHISKSLVFHTVGSSAKDLLLLLLHMLRYDIYSQIFATRLA